MFCAIPPFFLEMISCLVLIKGESGCSGRNSGSDGRGKMAVFPNEFGEIKGASSGIAIRADNRRFFGSEISLNRFCVARCDR